MGALIRIGALNDKNTFEGGAYSDIFYAYWKEGAKSNHYGKLFQLRRENRFLFSWSYISAILVKFV